MTGEFKSLKTKWKFGDGKKVKILKYSDLSDNDKLTKFRKWLQKDDKYKYMSENLFNFYVINCNR